MALKTNCKQVRSAVMDYIRAEKNYIVINYGIQETELENDNALCWVIYDIFRQEKLEHDLRFKAHKVSENYMFHEWASGLALGGMFGYYYCSSAVDLVVGILQETESEKARFSETEAEKLMTDLIYREIVSRKNKMAF